MGIHRSIIPGLVMAASLCSVRGAAMLNGQSQEPETTQTPVPVETKDSQPPSKAVVDPQHQKALEQAAQLLKLATDLKSEVDKTNQDILSLAVVRKAETIEHLAHAARKP